MPEDPKKPPSLADDDEEQTSIELDLNQPLPAEKPPAFDDEDEPTKVLDWDRAMKKSLK